MDNTARRVLSFIREHNLFSGGDRVLLSLSAGKDSIALLHILLDLRDELPLELHIFHLNHMTRGAESDGDEEFLAALAGRLEIPFHRERFDAAGARPGGRSFEEFAREARYRMLRETAERERCVAVATAHSLDDSVETVIMRIFEGTGIHGLGGIAPRRGNIVRPLLRLTSDEMYEYLRGRGTDWREDSSNSDTRYLRNFVRRELVPLLRGRFPGYARAVAGLSENARDQVLLLEKLIAGARGGVRELRAGGSAAIDLAKCADDGILLKHEIASAFRDLGAHVSAGMVDDIVRKLASDRERVELFRGRGLRAVRRREGDRSLILIAPDAGIAPEKEWEVPVDTSALPATIQIPGADIALSLSWSDEERFAGERADPAVAHIAVDGAGDIAVRGWRRGDSIRLGGGTRKIKELFIDLKIDVAVKHAVPLVTAGGDIALAMTGLFGAPAHRVADGYLVTEGRKKILAIRGFRN
ncbi:MAG TPA: tRNA lysidine(34) synthetase TilS [Spirochaetota bacterium]|nr:tRNA lysidine(34) synthetase TilS [Spirochaetota bacterium]